MSWTSVHEDATFLHAAVTDVAREDSLDYRMRMLCHILVDEMPRDGLAELIESLASLREFYLTRLELPAHVSSPSHVLEATLAGAYERPEFFATDE